MLESPTTACARDAIRAAHRARGDALIDILRWFRNSDPSK